MKWQKVNGGAINILIGAFIGGASQAYAGGSTLDIVRGAAFGALTGGFGAIASGATGAMRGIGVGMSALTGMIASS